MGRRPRDWGKFRNGGGSMANYGIGIRYQKRCFCLGVAAVAILSAAIGTSWADSAHEKARTARTQAVENARLALEKARTLGAETAAPYEYYTAEEYLDLAKRELKEGDRIGVAIFAAESEKYSFEASEKAAGGPR